MSNQTRDVKAVKHSDTTAQLIMVTDKAKKVWLENIGTIDGEPEYTGTVDIDQMAGILVWCLSWGLSLDSELPIIIKSRGKAS